MLEELGGSVRVAINGAKSCRFCKWELLGNSSMLIIALIDIYATNGAIAELESRHNEEIYTRLVMFMLREHF